MTNNGDAKHILANGGRVLNICARGKTVREAQQRAYAAVDMINWPEGFCRRDIGWQAIAREIKNNVKEFCLLNCSKCGEIAFVPRR